jgi:hypothetical protein
MALTMPQTSTIRTAIVLALAAGCRSAQVDPAKPDDPSLPPTAQLQQRTAFASVLDVEFARLGEPMFVRRSARWEQVSDVVLVYAIPASPIPFQVRAMPAPGLFLGDVPLREIQGPEPVMVYAAPRPAGPLTQLTFWMGGHAEQIGELSPQEVTALFQTTRRRSPQDLIVLGPAVVSGATPERLYVARDMRALVEHTRARADSLRRRR